MRTFAGRDAGRIGPLHRDDLDFAPTCTSRPSPTGSSPSSVRAFCAYHASFLDSPHAVALLASVRGHPA